MKEAVLNVLIKCLSYDFAGTTLDEAGEDMGTVQVNSLLERLMDPILFLTRFFKRSLLAGDPFLKAKILCRLYLMLIENFRHHCLQRYVIHLGVCGRMAAVDD